VGVRLPDWWDYPAACEHGHPWGPGRVLIGWKSCRCAPVLEAAGPADAVAAGCPGTVTPFNGDHSAGVQALSTRQFRDDRGPLRRIRP
jgi:hypothetical protein